MSDSKIILKKSSVPGKVPLPEDLQYGEIAINYADGILYYKSSDNTIESISTGTQFDGEPNGFADNSQAILAFDSGTRTLTITANDVSEFEFWANGEKYKRAFDTVTIPDIEGQYFIYFDEDGVIQYSSSITSDIILRYCFIANLYWDATNKRPVPYVENELHGAEMPGEVHYYLHRVFGTQYISGLDLTLETNGNGSVDSHCQLIGTAGVVVDEDITHIINARLLTDNIPVLYKIGNTLWRVDDTRPFPVINTGTGRAAYNFFDGNNWSLAEAGEGSYVLAHLYAVPGMNTWEGRYCIILGENYYSTIYDAQIAARNDIKNIKLGPKSVQELVPIGTLLIQTSSSYTNTPKAILVNTSDGETFVDWRYPQSQSSGGGVGISGFSGISGTSGFSGASGTSGVSGYSGTMLRYQWCIGCIWIFRGERHFWSFWYFW